MAASPARRRLAAATTPADREAAVRDLLREVAYVLHVTRRIGRRTDRPVIVPAVRRNHPAPDAAPAAAAV